MFCNLTHDHPLVVLAYLAGSIPFGVLVARMTGAPDPRLSGSGRTGGTNALRAMGRKRAAVVVGGDILKGAVPVLVARWLGGGDPALEAACGVAAVVGWRVRSSWASTAGEGSRPASARCW